MRNAKKQIIMIFSILFSLFFIFNFLAVADDTNNLSLGSKEEAKLRDFSDFYQDVTKDKVLKNSTVVLNGNENNVIELPEKSKAVKLSDSRIAIKYSEDDVSILPYRTNISYLNNQLVVEIPGEKTAFKIPTLVEIPIEKLKSNTKFKQSINKLNSYKVKIEFKELTNLDLKENINNIIISWGDGKEDKLLSESAEVLHTYEKSGKYDILIEITDDFGFSHEIEHNYVVEYEGHVLHAYLWADENKEPISISTFTIFGFLFVGLFFYSENGKIKILNFLAILFPMYTYLQKEDVLDQFVRGQIYGYIKTNPGVHYNRIRRELGIKNGTLSYHLRVLEKTELIKSRKEGLKYRAFYPTDMSFPKHSRFRLTELQLQIINLIKKRKGINQKEIAHNLEKKPQTINYNIKVLGQANIINIKRRGRKTLCYENENIDIKGHLAE